MARIQVGATPPSPGLVRYHDDNQVRKTTTIRVLAACTAFVLIAACIWAFVDIANAHKRAEVVAQISSGVLGSDASGVVILPERLAALSLGGTVLVSAPRPSQIMVLFTTWRGKGANFAGYLYTALPLSTADLTIGPNGKRYLVVQ